MLASTSRSQLLRSLLRSKLSAGSATAAGLHPARAFRVSAPALVDSTRPKRKSSVTLDAAMGGSKEHLAAETVVLNQKAATAAGSTGGAELMLSRFTKSTEVAVSKIFPAGFSWQAASAVEPQPRAPRPTRSTSS